MKRKVIVKNTQSNNEPKSADCLRVVRKKVLDAVSGGKAAKCAGVGSGGGL